MFHEDIDLGNLDAKLMKPDEARKVIHDVVTEQKRLAKENRDLRENLDAKVADLKAATQALAERQTVSHASGSENELKAYVKGDNRVRLRGEATEDDTWVPGLLDDEPVCRWQEDLQKAVEVASIVRMCRKDGKAPKADAAVRRILKRAPAPIQRAFADVESAGAEWHPDLMLPQLERELVAERKVANLFQRVQAGAKDITLPFLTTGFRPYKKGAISGNDPAQFTSSDLETAQRIFQMTGFAVRVQIDEDAAEDAIIDSIPLIRQELVSAVVDGEEDAIINGDTAATHQDSIASWNARSRWGNADAGTADHRTAFLGLRARAYDVSNTTDQNGAQSYAGFLSARAKLASPHGVAGDLVAIVSPEYYIVKLMGLTEVVTLEKFGSQATVLSGQLAQLGGVPIIISEFMTADLATTGLYTGSGATTGMLLFNRARFKIWERRGLNVELDKDITRGIVNMVATKRGLFSTFDSSTKKNVHYSYNLSAA